jgi:hypothetical protein
MRVPSSTPAKFSYATQGKGLYPDLQIYRGAGATNRFVSPTFLIGFGIGAFVGVGLALLAIAIAKPESKTTQAAPIEVTATPRATAETRSTLTPGVRTRGTAQVYIGPGGAYAIVGTIAGGQGVDVLGRDDGGEWIAVKFPPNSTARAWLRATDLEGLPPTALSSLDLLVPTPLAQAVVTPRGGSDGGVEVR